MTFRDFDKNQNGTLTLEELKAAFELYKVPITDT